MPVDALIFVALVVAWAIYLVPKALSHHEESVRSRSVEKFSQSMRVLARRDPVDRRNARLVVQPGRGAAAPVVSAKGPGPSPADLRARRVAARRAAARRRNVLLLLLTGAASTAAVAGFGVIDWWYVAIPGGLVLAWLLTCRLAVRRERGLGRRAADADAEDGPADELVHPDDFSVVRNEQGFDEVADDATTSVFATVGDDVRDPNLWDPLPMTLPTYVNAPAAARRSVSTIDLDSTGVWSSGRNEQDSALAREAEESERAERAERDAERRRASGS